MEICVGREQPGQNGVPDRGGIRGYPVADPDIDAKSGKPRLNAFDIDHIGPVENADRCGLIDLAHQASQHRPGVGSQIRTGDRIEAEIEHFQSPAETFAYQARD